MSYRRKRSDVTSRTKTAAARSPNERLEPGRAPSRPRGLQNREPSRFISGIVKVFSGLFTLALVSMIVLGGLSLAINHQYESAGPLESTRTITIPKGEGRIAIAERLEREGIISNRWTFIGGHLLQSLFGSKRSAELKAGEYEIKDHASMRQVMETLAEGHSILYKVTIPEGLTSQQIVERLKSEPSLSGEVANLPLEGTLLPDTYNFSKGASRQEILDRMQAEMKKVVTSLWDKRKVELPLRTPEDAVTFASIVEKETGRPEERDRVAAVFHNRLKKGMRLQSDPTIIYGLVGGQGALGRSITKADIEQKTPYNTYTINGLPPGPICNPGRAALEATLNPAKTNDLYFVADGTGGHAFSENYKDHTAAVQKWRETEKQAKASAANGTASKTSKASDADPDVVPIPSTPESGPEPGTSANPDATRAATTKSVNVTPDDPEAVPPPVRKPKKPQAN